MSLRINTNIAAMDIHRNLEINENAADSSMEKLSSGYRINSASDDAAGLAIANKLRATGASLTVAAQNVSEGTAMVNVAEGAANQVESILERMKELATQASSANSTSDDDKIQDEFQSLQAEITRITTNTNYDGTTLLNGTFGNGISTTTGFVATSGMTTSNITINGAVQGVYTIGDAGGVVTMTDGTSTQGVDIATATAGTLNFSLFGISLTLNSQHTTGGLAGSTITVSAAANGGVFQVGSGTSNDNQIGVQLASLTLSTLGLNTASVANPSSALTAMGDIDGALNTVNSVLGTIGASVNRFNYTYSNLQTSIENMSSAESTIRDVDMASEMTNFTKDQILEQAGTAMLAQANTSNQNILTLFH